MTNAQEDPRTTELRELRGKIQEAVRAKNMGEAMRLQEQYNEKVGKNKQK